MSNDTVEEFWTTINGWDRLPRNLFDQYVEQIQEDHAHDLAEHIREQVRGEAIGDWAKGVEDGRTDAADLIDPEVAT